MLNSITLDDILLTTRVMRFLQVMLSHKATLNRGWGTPPRTKYSFAYPNAPSEAGQLVKADKRYSSLPSGVSFQPLASERYAKFMTSAPAHVCRCTFWYSKRLRSYMIALASHPFSIRRLYLQQSWRESSVFASSSEEPYCSADDSSDLTCESPFI